MCTRVHDVVHVQVPLPVGMNVHAAAKSASSRLEAARRTIRVCKRREPQTQDLSKERWISRRARSPCSTADSTERNLRTMTTWSPTRPGEASYYDQLFQLASQGSGTEVTGQQAVDFFGHAGVAVTYLRDVWNVACQPNRVSLGKTDFYGDGDAPESDGESDHSASAEEW